MAKERDKTKAALLKEPGGIRERYDGIEAREEACRQTEEALSKMEKCYRHLVDNANDIIYRTDAEGRFTFFNPAAVKITGYGEAELIGKHYVELIDPAYRAAAERFYGKQYARKIPNTYYEYPIQTPDGRTVWLGQNVQLIPHGGGIEGFQAIARDITERKALEKEVEDSEEKLANILASIQAGVMLVLSLIHI